MLSNILIYSTLYAPYLNIPALADAFLNFVGFVLLNIFIAAPKFLVDVFLCDENNPDNRPFFLAIVLSPKYLPYPIKPNSHKSNVSYIGINNILNSNFCTMIFAFSLLRKCFRVLRALFLSITPLRNLFSITTIYSITLSPKSNYLKHTTYFRECKLIL